MDPEAILNQNAITFPHDKGTYALILELGQPRRIQIGHLGKIYFVVGFYIYIGSAFAAGGLKSRLSHHLQGATRPHWHIDYLRLYADIMGVWYCTDPVKRETVWVDLVAGLDQGGGPFRDSAITGFGATDSVHNSHLFYSSSLPSFGKFKQMIKQKMPEHGPVFQWGNR